MKNRKRQAAVLLWFSLLNPISQPVTAQPPVPEPAMTTTALSKSFWEWFDEYADDNGHVMDPITYEQTRLIDYKHTLLTDDNISPSKIVTQEPVTGEEKP